eukprot:GEMP01073405.1.p1 GENE.GEMP01073405.1~~GEMP01073405.1.p1  ORF type:complete len:249 (+),score=43.61 GEMP01073405.1:265-1011(+)
MIGYLLSNMVEGRGSRNVVSSSAELETEGTMMAATTGICATKTWLAAAHTTGEDGKPSVFSRTSNTKGAKRGSYDPTHGRLQLRRWGTRSDIIIPRALYDEGYRNITAIDTSAVAISAQTASEECEIEFCVMDVCRLEFPSNIFDVIIDKALLDVLATCYDSTRSARAVEEIYRVLEQGGVFVCVSHAPPERRLNLLTLNGAAHWRIEVTKLAKLSVPFIDLDAPGCFFVYICTKEAGENCHATSLVT